MTKINAEGISFGILKINAEGISFGILDDKNEFKEGIGTIKINVSELEEMSEPIDVFKLPNGNYVIPDHDKYDISSKEMYKFLDDNGIQHVNWFLPKPSKKRSESNE